MSASNVLQKDIVGSCLTEPVDVPQNISDKQIRFAFLGFLADKTISSAVP